MRGGMKTYRGSPTAARNYVQADRGRADDYYLAEGTGIAERYVASREAGVQRAAPLTGDGYEAWVAGVDPETGLAKGRLRHDDQAVRFVEVTVNGPKSWSLAAELHPDISAAYDAAQDRAATQIIGWLAQHATTRVGPRGQQVQVPAQQIEASVVRHYTSRAGDPHRHLHLQINARVLAAGKWRGLHTVGVRDSLDAINGIGHAAVTTDPGFRGALAGHGFTLDQAGEVTQLAPVAGAFSARATQIAANIDRYEIDWQATHPGQTPGPQLRQTWDARAWAEQRPDKVHPGPGAGLNGRWVGELRAMGYRDPDGHVPLETSQIGALDRDQCVEQVLARLGSRRSRWNAADVRGEVEHLLARHGIVTVAAVRLELAEDLTARAVTRCTPMLDRDGVPEHIRALTSVQALEAEADLNTRLAARRATVAEALPMLALATVPDGLDAGQAAAARLLAGDRALIVVEGAAGSGKTTTLAAARDLLAAQHRRMTVVTPTLKAAKVAAVELGSHAGSAAWLAFQHGYRWDEHGAWTRLVPGQHDPHTGAVYRGPAATATLGSGDLLLVDEAGMLDQDTARALLTIADEHHARLALVGDRHQLAAVGRGGVLDLAAHHVASDAHVTLEEVHRFTRTAEASTSSGTLEVVTDVEYADLSLAMRTGEHPERVFDALAERGQIVVHRRDADRVAALADLAADVLTDQRTVIVADTLKQVAQLNSAIRDRFVAAGRVDDRYATTTGSGQRIGVGDRVTTRRNDTTLDVANRDTWTVTHLNPDGSLEVTGHPAVGVTGHPGTRLLPSGYVAEHVQLAYASTVYGVQGDTATASHLVLGEQTGAASAYVGMTRGRQTNVAHLVAANLDDARQQWVAAFARDRADLGPGYAAQLAAQEAANYAQPRPINDVITKLRQAWTVEQNALERLTMLQPRAELLRQVAALRAEQATTMPDLELDYRQARDTAAQATGRVTAAETVVDRDTEQIRDALQREWDSQRLTASGAAQTIAAGPGRFRRHRADIAHAQATLQAWATGWKPYLPAIPTDPDHVARFAARRDGQAMLTDAFTHHARLQSEQLHPEHAEAQQAAEQASTREADAATAWHEASSHYSMRLTRYGTVARTPDPAARVTELDQLITTNQDRLATARNHIESLTRDPAILSRPADRLTNERAKWQRDRDIESLDKAARDRATATEHQHTSQHDHSFQHEPDHGIEFGR